MADRSVLVRVRGDISDFNRAMLAGAASTKTFTSSLDTSTDRAAMLTQSILAIGPALVPIGAAGVPAISGLTNQLGFAVAGAGVAALAFSGVGDALKATNDYAVEPTEANLAKMQETLNELGPAGAEFVGFLQQIRPELQGLQDAAQAGLFPGAQAGITDLLDLLPQAERIVSTIATSMGDLIAEAGDNLNDARWQEFFTFLENEARPTLMDLGRTLGNFAEGFANLWMAFDPLSDNFSQSFLQMSRDFSAWTDGLSETEGFQEFLDYVARVGPKAWDALGALGNALLQVVEAAAPVGEVMLPVITAVADTLAAIADSPAGPVLIGAAAGISAISRAVALYNVANGSALVGTLGSLAGTGPKIGAVGAGIGVLALSLTDLDNKAGLSNTAMFATVGLMAGPWGAAIGGGIGAVMDLQAANEGLASAVEDANTAMASGDVDALRLSMEKLNEELGSAEDDGSFGQSIANMADKASNSWLGFGGIVAPIIDNLTTSTAEAAPVAEAVAEAYEKARTAAQETKFEEAGLAGAMENTSQATRDQTEALLDNIATKNQARNEALSAAEAELNYERAIDSAAEAAKENGKTLDKGTEAGQANREALYRLAGAWNDLTPAQQNAKGASDRARQSFVDAAVAMGDEEERAGRLADRLLEIPPATSTQVKVPGLAGAVIGIANVISQLDILDGMNASASVRISVGGANLGATLRQLNMIDTFADGGLVRGPGGPRDDMVPALLSNKEFVVNAAATAKHLPLLQAINSGGRRVQRFADGGHVQATTAVVPTLDERRLARMVGSEVGRQTARAFEGARFYMAPDGSIRAKTKGA